MFTPFLSKLPATVSAYPAAASRLLCMLFTCLASLAPAWGQVITVAPAQPQADDTVEITFYANRGNQALKGHTGHVYAHTGVIIGSADEPSGWRYVQGNWGTDEARMRMERIGPDTYRWRIHIRSFYGIPPEEPFLQLALVFRSQNGAVVAKDEGEADIFYPAIEKFRHGPIEKADGADGIFAGKLLSASFMPDGGLLLVAEEGQVAVQFFGPGLFRLNYSRFPQATFPASEAVVAPPRPRGFSAAALPIQPEDFELPLEDGYRLTVQAQPLQLILQRGRQQIWQSGAFFFDDGYKPAGVISGLRMPLSPKEKIFGGGSRAVEMDRVGMRLYCYNTASYGYTWGETALNISIPFFLSDKGYGVFFDTYHRAYADIGKTDPAIWEFGAQDSVLSAFVFYQNSPAGIVSAYSRLTGHQPLPPRWAMGYIQSRYGYRSQEEAETVVQKTLDAGIPLDAMLFDLQWFGDRERMGDLDWDRFHFPDPAAMMGKLKAIGVQPLLITETYFVRDTRHFDFLADQGWFAARDDGTPFVIPDFWAGPAGLLDVFQPQAMDWFWAQYRRLSAYGVAGWWCDSGEPENHPKGMIHARGRAERVHNIYAHYWNKGLYERFRAERPNERFFQLNRSGYAGMQRFAVFPWSGDVSRNWEALRAQVPIMLANGLGGIGYMHSDLGGFTGGEKNGELFLRWLQLGVFSPLMRVHGDATAFDPEPVFYEDAIRQAATDLIRLRYQFLPYNLQLARKHTSTGLPLARPLWLHYPFEPEAWTEPNAYLWGKNLLVCPVTSPGTEAITCYAPGGRWYDWFGGTVFRGEQRLHLEAPIARIPVLARAGSWVPTASPLRNTQGMDTAQFTLHWFAEPGTFTDTLRFDDGYSLSYAGADGTDSLLVSAHSKGSRLEVWLRLSNTRFVQGNTVKLAIHGVAQPPKKAYRLQGKAKIPLHAGVFDPETGSYQLDLMDWNQDARLYFSGVKWR